MKADSHITNDGKTLLYILVKAVFILSCIMLVPVIINPVFHVDDINTARIANTRATVDALCLSLETYKYEMGHYPVTNDPRMVSNELTGYKASDEKIDILYTTNALWNGPYYETKSNYFRNCKFNEVLIDPWGSPYCYDFSGIKAKIWSWGPNRKNEYGKGDDIPTWDVPGKSPIKQPLALYPIISIILFVVIGSLMLIIKCVIRN